MHSTRASGPAIRPAFAAIAASVVAGVAAATVAALRFGADGDLPGGESAWVIAWLVVGVVNLVAGASLTARYGYRRVGVCLTVVGVAALALAVSTEATFVVSRPQWAWADEVRRAAQPIASGVLAGLLPWEFARGRRGRVIEVVWWSTALAIAASSIGSAAGAQRSGVDLVDVSTALVVVSATAATCRVVAHWWSHRRTDDSVLLGWLASGSVVALLAVVPEALEFGWEAPAGDVAGSVMLIATVPLLLVGTVVDSLRRRRIRFRGATHHVLGWTVMAGATAVAYALVVAGLGQVVGGDGPTWLLVAATGVIALAAEPARRRIQRSVDRLVWGARDDPLAVVRHVVDLVGPDSGNDLLPALVRSLQRDLRFDSVAIDVRRDDGWDRVAQVGPPSGAEHHVALEQQGDVVGRLVVASGGRIPVRQRDAQVLAELAGPLALAVGWVRLAGDLRRAGVEIVSAREEERRRIRRDLHDGLGPSLTGVSLGVRTAMRQLERSAGGELLAPTRELLARAADEIDVLVDEVKRIVRDLRPTALDQLGFVEAVTEFARSVSGELDVRISVPRTPLDLPAVIEVAAYRIVTEAMTNVVRHARAMRCWLTITTGDRVDIHVVDDGVGINGAENEGVGWAAMRERAAELGGTFAVGPNAPRGTHLHVELPVMLP